MPQEPQDRSPLLLAWDLYEEEQNHTALSAQVAALQAQLASLTAALTDDSVAIVKVQEPEVPLLTK